MRRLLVSPLFVCCLYSAAHADNDPTSVPLTTSTDPAQDMVEPLTQVYGNGVKVGEGTVINPVIGAETGYVSNVFYTDTNQIGSALVRVLGMAGVGSLPAQRIDHAAAPEVSELADGVDYGSLAYRADAYAAYEQYISGNQKVLDQSGLYGGFVFRGIANPSGPLYFSFLEHFDRLIRATNFESSDNVNRDINGLTLRLNYQPKGSTLGGYIYYTNTLDLFESNAQQFADRMDHTFGARFIYQWLPLSQLYVDVSEGVFGGIGSSSTKVSSYPLTALAGITTQLTLNLTVDARIGYQQGFYSSGPDYAAPIGGIMLAYRYSPVGRAMVLYQYAHQDSINANFYRDHVLQLDIEQQMEPFLLFIRPQIRFREYDGLPPMVMAASDIRNDVLVGASAGIRYYFRHSIALTGEYHLLADDTDFRYMSGPITLDPSYVRHEVMAGLRGAF